MKKPAAATELIDYINAQIFAGVYLPGSRIPSIRALMRKFDLTYATTLAAVDYLCGGGLLVKCPQSGVFVRHIPEMTAQHGGKCIGILSAEVEPGFGLIYVVLGAIRRAAGLLGYPLVPMPCGLIFDLTPEKLKAVVAAHPECSALIAVMEMDWKIDRADFGIPVVGVMQENDWNGQLSIVNPDPFNAAYLAAEYFRKHGKKQVTILTDPRPTYWHRGKIFEALWRRDGGEVADFIVMNSDAIDFLVDHPERGYFFTSDNLLFNCAMLQQKRTGENIIGRYCLLAVDGKSRICHEWGVHFPSIVIDWARIGEIAVEEAVGRLENLHRRPRRIYVPGRLREL
jgi:DNA-binding LacI/PurR family transcriptional regulator